MIIPIRCFTCNKVIAHLWEEYLNKLQIHYINEDIPNSRKKRFPNNDEICEKTIAGKILDDLNINKYCCRSKFISHVDLCEKI